MTDFGTFLFLVVVWLVLYRKDTVAGIKNYRERREFKHIIKEYEKSSR